MSWMLAIFLVNNSIVAENSPAVDCNLIEWRIPENQDQLICKLLLYDTYNTPPKPHVWVFCSITVPIFVTLRWHHFPPHIPQMQSSCRYTYNTPPKPHVSIFRHIINIILLLLGTIFCRNIIVPHNKCRLTWSIFHERKAVVVIRTIPHPNPMFQFSAALSIFVTLRWCHFPLQYQCAFLAVTWSTNQRCVHFIMLRGKRCK